MENNKAKLRSDVGTSRDANDVTRKDTGICRERISKYQTITLDPWQKRVLKHTGNILLCTGRQNGKTLILSVKAGKYMLKHKNSKILVVSLTEDQAQLIIIMIRNYLESNNLKSICTGTERPTKNKILLKNGSQVLSRPVGVTGDSVRGFTGDILIIDEAARMQESIFTASKPTLFTTGGKIWMCSTPFGKKGYFYESWLNKYKRWEVFHVNSEDVAHNRVICDSWTEQQRADAIRLLSEEKNDMSELQYAQEYLAMFSDDLQQFFSDELINKVCVLKRRKSQTTQGYHKYFLGCDFARMGGDSTSYEILDKINNDYIEQVENLTESMKLTTYTHDKILDLDTLWDFKEIGLDVGAGSLGVGIYDFLLRSAVKRKVVPLSNLSRNLDHRGEKKKSLMKEDMYSVLLMMMERGNIKLLDDDDLRLSLKSVQKEFIMKNDEPTRVVIFSNPHKFSHIAEGLVRASWLANTKNINTFIDWV